MTNEEIEELKEFTIDLTDIDELALGLEVCSKKSNMVIQEFIDTIVQLQQENQSLQKENKILRENAEHNDKVVDKVNWENQKLKKELEEYKLITIDYQELEARNQELKKQLEENKHKNLYNTCLPYSTGYKKAIKEKENQQKEFIEWLTNETNINPYDISDYVYEDIINTILSKYYEIIEK